MGGVGGDGEVGEVGEIGAGDSAPVLVAAGLCLRGTDADVGDGVEEGEDGSTQRRSTSSVDDLPSDSDSDSDRSTGGEELGELVNTLEEEVRTCAGPSSRVLGAAYRPSCRCYCPSCCPSCWCCEGRGDSFVHGCTSLQLSP